MDKLAKIKLMKQIKKIKESTKSCEEFLTAYRNSLAEDMPNAVVTTEFNTVIQHQKNMIKLFSNLEQQLTK